MRLWVLLFFSLIACGSPNPDPRYSLVFTVSGPISASYQLEDYSDVLAVDPTGRAFSTADYMWGECSAPPASCGVAVHIAEMGATFGLWWPTTNVAAPLTSGTYTDASIQLPADMICFTSGSASWELHAGYPTPSDNSGNYSVEVTQSALAWTATVPLNGFDAWGYVVHGKLHATCVPGKEPNNTATGTLTIDAVF
jgi:hypothetical protein